MELLPEGGKNYGKYGNFISKLWKFLTTRKFEKVKALYSLCESETKRQDMETWTG